MVLGGSCNLGRLGRSCRPFSSVTVPANTRGPARRRPSNATSESDLTTSGALSGLTSWNGRVELIDPDQSFLSIDRRERSILQSSKEHDPGKCGADSPRDNPGNAFARGSCPIKTPERDCDPSSSHRTLVTISVIDGQFCRDARRTLCNDVVRCDPRTEGGTCNGGNSSRCSDARPRDHSTRVRSRGCACRLFVFWKRYRGTRRAPRRAMRHFWK